MGAKQNMELIEGHIEAIRARDEATYAADYAEDAVVRMAGVPRSLGGVIAGRDRIMENFQHQTPGTFEVHQMFGDDAHVCVVAKVTNTLGGTELLQGSDQPFTTFECVVYRIKDGHIREHTTYLNWLDAYVQAGLVDLPLKA
jgi:ketosteroid isomerase-like protein